jgi:hypothetical protein
MIAHVFGEGGVADRLTATPRCNEDFCDGCGDCLSCYWEDPCRDGGEHTWVVYEDQAAEWWVAHPEAVPFDSSTA